MTTLYLTLSASTTDTDFTEERETQIIQTALKALTDAGFKCSLEDMSLESD